MDTFDAHWLFMTPYGRVFTWDVSQRVAQSAFLLIFRWSIYQVKEYNILSY